MKYHIISERTAKEDCRIHTPEDAYEILKKYKYERKRTEHFLVVTLNGAHGVIKIHIVSMGTVNKTIIHPREVFRPALIDNACAVLLVHNHPSGSLTPSPEDEEITKRLGKAGSIMGIGVLDHMIISKKGFYSFLTSNPSILNLEE